MNGRRDFHTTEAEAMVAFMTSISVAAELKDSPRVPRKPRRAIVVADDPSYGSVMQRAALARHEMLHTTVARRWSWRNIPGVAAGHALIADLPLEPGRAWAITATLGVLASALAALTFAFDLWTLAAISILAVVALDSVDGQYARRSEQPVRNVLFDCALDRIVDIMLLGGVAWSALRSDDTLLLVLTTLALLMTMLGTFVGAQTVALGIYSTKPVLGRGERMLVLFVAVAVAAVLDASAFGSGAVAIATGMAIVCVVAAASVLERFMWAVSAASQEDEIALLDRAANANFARPDARRRRLHAVRSSSR